MVTTKRHPRSIKKNRDHRNESMHKHSADLQHSAKNIQWGNDSLFDKWVLGKMDIYLQKIEIEYLFLHHKK